MRSSTGIVVWALAIGTIGTIGTMATIAAADTKKLAGRLEPSRKLPVADRETKLCADSAQILDAANAISDKRVPANVPLDKIAWAAFVGDVANAADSINDLCKRKSHAMKSVDGSMKTVASQIEVLYASLDALVEAGRPRTLPAQLATVRASVDGLSWKAATFCKQAKAIVAGLGKVERPAASDKVVWDAQLARVQQVAQGTQTVACDKAKHVPEEVGGLQPELAGAFYKLVLLVPAR
ncbi:MAG: hypothetical protein NT062_07780 [Proteobacteria bacterium]|nr:hypothetical protein [Pseudomonadota bacterium]